MKVVWREYKAGADPRTNLALLLFHRPLCKFHVEPTTCAAVALQFGQVLTSSVESSPAVPFFGAVDVGAMRGASKSVKQLLGQSMRL